MTLYTHPPPTVNWGWAMGAFRFEDSGVRLKLCVEGVKVGLKRRKDFLTVNSSYHFPCRDLILFT